ncbi:MAG: hypothetical protein ACTHN5_11235 [Phycisphaerae bacterium]
MDTVISHNVIHDGTATIWPGITRGSIVENNIATGFSDWMPLSTATVIGNNWQA